METLTTKLQNEDSLVIGLKTNDQKVFEQIYNRFSGALFGTIIKWVKDGEVAENLLQEVFVKAWRNNFQYDETKGRLFTWLYNISRNVCIDYLRSKTFKNTKAANLSEDMGALFGENLFAENQVETIGLKQLLDRLRKDEKDVIQVIYFNGFTQKEAAELLCLPLGTVKTRVNMAIKKLRRYFNADWDRAVHYISAN
jgi:RNA polymerase sigma-70 factor (ECF subfamily)